MATKRPAKSRGRSPIPASAKKSEKYPLNLSKEDIRVIEAAASLDEDKPYAWARRMLLIAARQRLQAAGLPTTGAVPRGGK